MTALAYAAAALLAAQILTLAATRITATRRVWHETAAAWLLLTGGPILLPAFAAAGALADRGWFARADASRECYDEAGETRAVGPARLGLVATGTYVGRTRVARFVIVGRGRVAFTIGRNRPRDPATRAA